MILSTSKSVQIGQFVGNRKERSGISFNAQRYIIIAAAILCATIAIPVYIFKVHPVIVSRRRHQPDPSCFTPPFQLERNECFDERSILGSASPIFDNRSGIAKGRPEIKSSTSVFSHNVSPDTHDDGSLGCVLFEDDTSTNGSFDALWNDSKHIA